MPKFVIDDRDHGLRGAADERVYEFAQEEEAVILTGDRDFGNILRFPLGDHFGIVVAHFPNEMPTRDMNQYLLERFKDLSEEEFRGNVIIIETAKIRIRRR